MKFVSWAILFIALLGKLSNICFIIHFYNKFVCISCFVSSATWPYAVRRLAQSYLKEPMIVYVGTLDLVVSLIFITIKNIY